MKANTANSFVIEKFRQQRQRMKKLIFALVLVVVIGAAVPLILRALSIPQGGWMTAWGCLLGIVLLGLAFVALLTQMCPSCGKPVGEEFWMVRYCPRCGTKLRED